MIVQELSPSAIGAAIKNLDLDRCADRRSAVQRYQGVGLEDEVRKYFAREALAQISVDAQRVARRFVDKRYSVYQRPPTRETTFADYAAVQGNLDRVAPWVERLSGVLNTLAMLVTVDEDSASLHYLPLVEFDPIWLMDDPEPYGVAYPLFAGDTTTRREDRTWIVWTDGLHFLCSGGGVPSAVVVGDAVNAEMVNPYGKAPVVWVQREPGLDGDWWGPMAEDLLSAQRTYNVLGVQGNLGAMFQALGQEVIIGVNDARDIVRRPDRAIVLPTGADYRMDGPPGGLNQLEAWMRWKLDSLAATMGLKIKWADGTGGATSGEHQRILEVELTTSIMSDFALWEHIEQERHEVARAVYQTHFGRDLGDELSINFTEPNIPLSQAENQAQFDYELGKGLASLQDYYRRLDPSITDEQIAAKLAKVQEERAAFAPAAAPTAQAAPRTGGLAALLNAPVE